MSEELVRCSLCGCSSVNRIDCKVRNAEDDRYKMYRCSGCETHFLYPVPEDGQLEEYYDGKFREEVHSSAYYDKEHLDRVFRRFYKEACIRAERVRQELQVSDTVLEIGCSVGYFMKAVAPYVDRVYGTEWDEKAGQYIRDSFPEFTVAKNPQDFGIKFDRIFMFHVLEHISDPVSFLSALKGMLNPGGVIYIEVPNVDDVLVRTYRCRDFMNFYYKKAHLYNFNKKGISYILEKAGLNGETEYIQRYDISNHMVWLNEGVPGGNGRYKSVLDEEVNAHYVSALKKAGQTDTLFIKVRAL